MGCERRLSSGNAVAAAKASDLLLRASDLLYADLKCYELTRRGQPLPDVFITYTEVLSPTACARSGDVAKMIGRSVA